MQRVELSLDITRQCNFIIHVTYILLICSLKVAYIVSRNIRFYELC